MKGPLPLLLPALVALSSCVVLGLLAFLAGRSRPVSSPVNDRVVFRYRFLLRTFAIFASIFLPAAATFLLRLIPRNRMEPIYAVGAFLLVAMICLPLLWKIAWYYIELDANGVAPFRVAQDSVLSMDEIVEVSYSGLNMWFIIRLEDGARIRVPLLVANLKEFLVRMEQHLAAETLRQSRKGYEKVGRPFPALVNDPVLEARPPR